MGKNSTSNNLNQQFVFVNKDAKSKHLTRSHGVEKQTIYGHVRRHLVKSHLPHEQQDSDQTPTATPAIVDRTRRRKSFKAVKDATRYNDVATSEDGMPIDDTIDRASDMGHERLSLATAGLGIIKELETTPYARSYSYFRQMTISEATGFSDVQFWNTSLQLSNSHEAVFHALTSLGALHESVLSTDATSRDHAYRESLVHCNRAIRATVAESCMPLPLLLMTCVIFATIQVFADAPKAQRTLESGINLAYTAQKGAAGFPSSQTAILEMAYRMMQRYQSRLTLVLQPTTIIREHKEVLDAQEPMPLVPSSFESLLEAREILQQICDWSFRFSNGAMSLKPVELLQRQWLTGVDGFSTTTGLHPLSTRSLNLLKLTRLASVCLIAAQHLSHAASFDDCFPTFRRLLDLYHDDFALSKENTIFTTVFEIDDNVTDVLRRADTSGATMDRVEEAHSAPTNGESWNEFFFGTNDSGKSSPSLPDLTRTGPAPQLQSLEFFPRTSMARLRLRDTAADAEAGIEERWFSLLGDDKGVIKGTT